MLLKLYEAEHADGEGPAAFFRRVDPKRVVSALADVAAAPPTTGEEMDVGEDAGFHVAIGAGECAA
jgi:hypothetical protein